LFKTQPLDRLVAVRADAFDKLVLIIHLYESSDLGSAVYAYKLRTKAVELCWSILFGKTKPELFAGFVLRPGRTFKAEALYQSRHGLRQNRTPPEPVDVSL
jgi:hypothetical protein